MNDIENDLLKIMCTGLGEGNSNIGKLSSQLAASYPERAIDDIKKEIVEVLRELVASGQMQIITNGWEIGYEFFYICSKRL